jgi:hypothetical protein
MKLIVAFREFTEVPGLPFITDSVVLITGKIFVPKGGRDGEGVRVISRNRLCGLFRFNREDLPASNQ